MLINICLLLMVGCVYAAESLTLSSFQEGLKLIEGLAKDNKNVVVSPLSLYLALSLLQPGLTDAELTKLQTYMGVTKTGEQWGQLMESVTINNSTRGILNTVANSVWTNSEEIDIPSAVSQELESKYHSLMALLGPDYAASLDQMNQWISNSTNGLVKKGPFTSAKELEPLLVVLINALYFKSEWSVPFDADLTASEKFYGCDGSVADVQMMKMDSTEAAARIDGFEGEFHYAESSSSQVLKLNYGLPLRDQYGGVLGHDFYLLLELPNDGDVDKLLANHQTNGVSADTLKLDLKPRKGTVWLPKFKLESRYMDLLTIMLNNDFPPSLAPYTSYLSANSSYPSTAIGSIQQKTVLDVSEAGTEGAAVTVITIVGTGFPQPQPPPPPPFEFKAQRPFLLTLVHSASGAPLFQGKIDSFAAADGPNAGNPGCTFASDYGFETYEGVDENQAVANTSTALLSLVVVFVLHFLC